MFHWHDWGWPWVIPIRPHLGHYPICPEHVASGRRELQLLNIWSLTQIVGWTEFFDRRDSLAIDRTRITLLLSLRVTEAGEETQESCWRLKAWSRGGKAQDPRLFWRRNLKDARDGPRYISTTELWVLWAMSIEKAVSAENTFMVIGHWADFFPFARENRKYLNLSRMCLKAWTLAWTLSDP